MNKEDKTPLIVMMGVSFLKGIMNLWNREPM